VLLVLALDRLAFEPLVPWRRVAADVPHEDVAARGIARDQVELARIRSAPPALPRVFVVGASRAEAGFHAEWLRGLRDPALAFARLAHAGMLAPQVRSVVGELVSARAAAVVWVASEVELFHPLTQPAWFSAPSPSALVDYASTSGPARVVEERERFYRLALACALHSYRYRRVLGLAGLDRLREFPGARRLGTPPLPPDLYDPGELSPAVREARERLLAEASERLAPGARVAAMVQVDQLSSLAPGDDARISMALTRRSVELLRGAGVRVVWIEPPLYPGAQALYDEAVRSEFRAFLGSLHRDDGVVFVPRERGPHYEAADFSDLTHLGRSGARKLTRQVYEVLRATLPRPPEA